MAFSSPVSQLLQQHSQNPVQETDLSSSSNKSWCSAYPPITNLIVHTFANEHGGTEATYDRAFLGPCEDDALRLQEQAYPPNYRFWRLATEEDGINWFHTEVSNVVLAAWARYPCVRQASHEKPLAGNYISETVDVGYSVSQGHNRAHMAIGEFKRYLVKPGEWQAGNLKRGQLTFSRELRGYAYLYRCPHIFCFDNSTLLMLQFRASALEDIRDPNCAVDCWVLPRHNYHGVSLRYAFYQFLVQGFRRCQGLWALTPSLYGIPPERREFYNGRPLWKVEGHLHARPWGHRRRIDPDCGAFYWTDSDGETPLQDENGQTIWDTGKIW